MFNNAETSSICLFDKWVSDIMNFNLTMGNNVCSISWVPAIASLVNCDVTKLVDHKSSVEDNFVYNHDEISSSIDAISF